MRTFKPKTSVSVLSVAAALLMAACGPDGGQMAAETSGGAPDAGLDPVAALLGTWQYSSGAVLFSCSDGSKTEASAAGGTKTVTAGANTSRVVVADDTGCVAACALSGNTLTCETSVCDDNGGQFTTTSDVFTIVGDQLHEDAAMTFANADGSTCQAGIVEAVLTKTQ